jgi:protoheme IX farnesyltransferase
LKPGITVSNTISAVAGYFLGVSTVDDFNGWALIGLTLGIAGVIGSACVANNILDEKIDARMKRTKRREVVTGRVSKRAALVYSVLLGIVGFVLILALTNVLTAILGAVAYVSYVAIYGAAKRTTIWSTVIGTLPGALPLVAGYTAITGQLDAAAAILFVMMVFWQLGHFYAIAMFRRDDYAAAGLPVWSVAKGLVSTKRQLFLFVWLFLLSAPLLTVLGYTGVMYAVAMTGVGVIWVVNGFKKYGNDVAWARRMFFVSLTVLLTMCLLIAIGGFLL